EEGEEEVTLRGLNDAIDTQCREQRRKGRRGRKPVSAMLLQVATPVLVDDGGRRRNRASSFTESGFSFRPFKSEPLVSDRCVSSGIGVTEMKTDELSFSPTPSVAWPGQSQTDRSRDSCAAFFVEQRRACSGALRFQPLLRDFPAGRAMAGMRANGAAIR